MDWIPLMMILGFIILGNTLFYVRNLYREKEAKKQQWLHIAFTNCRGTKRLYLNGLEVRETEDYTFELWTREYEINDFESLLKRRE